MSSRKAIVWFDEVGKNAMRLLNGKGADLGEMTKLQVPVPPGFAVTSKACSTSQKPKLWRSQRANALPQRDPPRKLSKSQRILLTESPFALLEHLKKSGMSGSIRARYVIANGVCLGAEIEIHGKPKDALSTRLWAVSRRIAGLLAFFRFLHG